MLTFDSPQKCFRIEAFAEFCKIALPAHQHDESFCRILQKLWPGGQKKSFGKPRPDSCKGVLEKNCQLLVRPPVGHVDADDGIRSIRIETPSPADFPGLMGRGRRAILESDGHCEVGEGLVERGQLYIWRETQAC